MGSPMCPTFMAKTTGFLFMIAGVPGGPGRTRPDQPRSGSSARTSRTKISYAVQPDWYMGWLDGALRIFPSWEIHAFGHSVGNVFFPGVVLPGITFGLLFAWPWLEARFSKDRAVHHLCDRPRDAPVRTGFGVAALAFYVALFAAAGTDVIASTINVSENAIIWALRVAVIVLPVVCGYVAYRLCKELAAVDAGRRRPPAVIIRSPGGGYTAIEPSAPVESSAPVGSGAPVEDAIPD